MEGKQKGPQQQTIASRWLKYWPAFGIVLLFIAVGLVQINRGSAAPGPAGAESVGPAPALAREPGQNLSLPGMQGPASTPTGSPPLPAAAAPSFSQTSIPSGVTAMEAPAQLRENELAPAVQLPEPDPWDGDTRVTILILGLDYSDWESEERTGPPRSDTMLLLTIDPASETAGILSIPRDLWVDIPGMIRPNKINAAHRFGELYNLPGGGPGLAMRTIEQLLGIPIHYYARVDFRAFEGFIDELGGVEIDVPEEIVVDPIGPGNTVTLKPGRQRLDGPVALAYARTRSTMGGDYDRAARQHEIIHALQEQQLKLTRLPRLILKAPALYKELSSGIQTNLNLQQAIKLTWLAAQISPEDVQSAVLGPNQLVAARAEDGQHIFLPVPERIQFLVSQMFGAGSAGALPLEERMQGEEARISLVNASRFEGLAEKTAAYLEAKGALVEKVSEGEETIPLTRIMDSTGKPYTVQYLVRLMGITWSEIVFEHDPEAEADIVVILGEDWARNHPRK